MPMGRVSMRNAVHVEARPCGTHGAMAAVGGGRCEEVVAGWWLNATVWLEWSEDGAGGG